MKLPRKVMINHRNWMVVKENTHSGANFNYEDSTIRIGTCKNSDREVLANMIHEVGEISCVERGVRAQKSMMSNESKDYIFTCNHDRFCDVMNDVSRVVGDIMKLE